MTGKNVTGTVEVFKKRSITLKNAWLPPHFMLWMEVASLFNKWLVSGCEQKVFRLYFGWTRKAVRDTKNAVATILLSKTYQKWIFCYHLSWSFKIFINVFAFLFVKENSKEICQEISFPSFFRKCWCQHFCWYSRLIISEKCVATPIFGPIHHSGARN